MTQPDDDDLQRFRTIDEADVLKAGAVAATLTRTSRSIEFRYLPEWIDGGMPAIATSLPVTAESVVRPGGALPEYFAGLLPEGRRLGALGHCAPGLESGPARAADRLRLEGRYEAQRVRRRLDLPTGRK